MDFQKILDILKLSPKYFLGIAIASGVLVFSPSNLIEKIGLENLVKNYRMWIGGVFLISLTLTIIETLIWILNKITKSMRKRNTLNIRMQRLHNLSADEREILRYYFYYNTRSQILNCLDGTVRELEFYRIIYRAGNIAPVMLNSNFDNIESPMPYNIQPWAWDYLNQNLNLLN